MPTSGGRLIQTSVALTDHRLLEPDQVTNGPNSPIADFRNQGEQQLSSRHGIPLRRMSSEDSDSHPAGNVVEAEPLPVGMERGGQSHDVERGVDDGRQSVRAARPREHGEIEGDPVTDETVPGTDDEED